MLVALISDVHGNLTALDTVLADLERERPDGIVCLGDVAATGPQPCVSGMLYVERWSSFWS